MINKKKILFLCTGNSCRSQMAEGWCNHFHGNKYEVYSAGTEKHELNQRAVRVMKEVHVDISHHKSKTVLDLPVKDFDIVFTVCSSANESCPVFSSKSKVIHVPFDDPPSITKDMQDENEILAVYRRVRDEIKSFIMCIDKYFS